MHGALRESSRCKCICKCLGASVLQLLSICIVDSRLAPCQRRRPAVLLAKIHILIFYYANKKIESNCIFWRCNLNFWRIQILLSYYWSSSQKIRIMNPRLSFRNLHGINFIYSLDIYFYLSVFRNVLLLAIYRRNIEISYNLILNIIFYLMNPTKRPQRHV